MRSRFELHATIDRLAAWARVPAGTIRAPAHTHDESKRSLHPVLRRSGSHERTISWMREGLIPSYACDDHDAAKRTEAHAEDVACDSCFRSAFRRRRCVVPAQAIREVRHLSPGVIHPCTFSLESGEIFGIAAVWETWINDEGHAVESFAIVTTRVTQSLRTLFERMPVVLQGQSEQDRWLFTGDPAETPVELLKPLSLSQLCDWKLVPDTVRMSLGGYEFPDGTSTLKQ